MKKIAMSLATIAAVMLLAVSATSAYLNDTETSHGNSYAVGTIDLKVDNQDDPNVVTVVRSNMVPHANWTYQGYNQQFVLKNNGTLPGTASWTIKNIENFENTCVEPEVAINDTTCGSGNNQGELGQYTWVQWSRNQSPWGSFGPQFNPFNTASDVKVTGPVMQPGETLNLYMWLDFPWRSDDMENLTQSDSMKFDIEFKLEQLH